MYLNTKPRLFLIPHVVFLFEQQLHFSWRMFCLSRPTFVLQSFLTFSWVHDASLSSRAFWLSLESMMHLCPPELFDFLLSPWCFSWCWRKSLLFSRPSSLSPPPAGVELMVVSVWGRLCFAVCLLFPRRSLSSFLLSFTHLGDIWSPSCVTLLCGIKSLCLSYAQIRSRVKTFFFVSILNDVASERLEPQCCGGSVCVCVCVCLCVCSSELVFFYIKPSQTVDLVTVALLILLRSESLLCWCHQEEDSACQNVSQIVRKYCLSLPPLSC